MEGTDAAGKTIFVLRLTTEQLRNSYPWSVRLTQIKPKVCIAEVSFGNARQAADQHPKETGRKQPERWHGYVHDLSGGDEPQVAEKA